jgi:UDP-N-acetylglucosamine--N-acetylmuramyl-(pentapeptide) pyrophosphoryl-undecaprenol N-acetylglucosamine transferase
MLAATSLSIPSIIQEQNSFAGIANKQVANKVARVCVAYEGMDKYFPAEKIVITGNPVRKEILSLTDKRSAALNKFGFDGRVKTLLVIGGSLGAKTINESIIGGIEKIIDAQIQLIWQTGKSYYEPYKARLGTVDLRKIRVHAFLKEMDLAYAAADVVISRAGAIAVSELCVVKKACILVPSPNVAEDHQTKNAMALVSKNAAVMISDNEAKSRLVNESLALLFDGVRLEKLATNIASLAKPNATDDIVNEIEKLIGVDNPVYPKVGNRNTSAMMIS